MITTMQSLPDKIAASEKLAYTIAELCQVVGISRATIYKEIKAERLRIRKVGKRTLVPADEVRAWLKL